MDYTSLIRNGYAHIYALVDYTTGEARENGQAHHLVLANCRTNKTLAEIKLLGNA